MKCEICDKEFVSKEARNMHMQAKHSSLSKDDKEKKVNKQKIIKNYKKKGIYLISLIALGFLIFWFISGLQNYEAPFTEGQIHWHATLQLSACGKNVPLPTPTHGTTVHGSSFVGTPLMHLHEGPTIHVEGLVRREEDISLGKFMEVIDMNFKNDEFLEFKNGDTCNDQLGTVRLFVNGRESQELSDKTIRDGEEYEIRFE